MTTNNGDGEPSNYSAIQTAILVTPWETYDVDINLIESGEFDSFKAEELCIHEVDDADNKLLTEEFEVEFQTIPFRCSHEEKEILSDENQSTLYEFAKFTADLADGQQIILLIQK